MQYSKFISLLLFWHVTSINKSVILGIKMFCWVWCCTHPKGHNIDSNFKQANQYPSCFETNSLWSIEAGESLREELWNCTIVGHATACIGQFDNRNSNLLTCLILWHSNWFSLDYSMCKKVMLCLFLFNHVFIILLTYNLEIWAERDMALTMVSL